MSGAPDAFDRARSEDQLRRHIDSLMEPWRPRLDIARESFIDDLVSARRVVGKVVRIGDALVRPESVDAVIPANVGATRSRILCHGCHVEVDGDPADVARLLGLSVDPEETP
jgi:hypothetical protein